MTVLLPLIISLLLLPLIVRLWRDLRVTRRLRRHGARATGKLIGFTVPDELRGKARGLPVATFVVDNQEYTINGDAEFAREGPFRGHCMTIYYDPDNPADAIIALPFDAAQPYLLAALCVTVSILLGVSAVGFVTAISAK